MWEEAIGLQIVIGNGKGNTSDFKLKGGGMDCELGLQLHGCRKWGGKEGSMWQ